MLTICGIEFVGPFCKWSFKVPDTLNHPPATFGQVPEISAAGKLKSYSKLGVAICKCNLTNLVV